MRVPWVETHGHAWSGSSSQKWKYVRRFPPLWHDLDLIGDDLGVIGDDLRPAGLALRPYRFSPQGIHHQ